MAIKGKKKSRGSQARRRPAQAPRPQAYGAARTPWYRTSGGRVGLAVGIVLLLAAAGGLIAKYRADANERAAARAAIEDYTETVRLLQQEVAPTGAELVAAPVSLGDPAFADLDENAESWAETFEAALGDFTAAGPPGGHGSDAVFRNVLSLYAAAARTYGLAAGLEGRAAELALGRAAEQVALATGLWGSGVGILDFARVDVGLQPAAVPAPTEVAGGAPMELQTGEDDGGDQDQ